MPHFIREYNIFELYFSRYEIVRMSLALQRYYFFHDKASIL